MKVNAKITKIIDKPDSSIKAFASVTLDGYFAVHGVKPKANSRSDEQKSHIRHMRSG